MKRWINLAIIKYQMLIISGTKKYISDDALVRYIIFSLSYPDFDKEIKRMGLTLERLKEDHLEIETLVGDELSTEMIISYL